MGTLTHEEKNSLYAVQRMMRTHPGMLTILSGRDAPAGGDTVAWLRAKVESYKPDIIFIDGVYLLSDIKNAKKDHERVMNISRAIRQMILDTRVPVLVTHQANRKAAGHQEANSDELAYSDAISQDATSIIRIINEKATDTVAMVLGGVSREFSLNGFRINAKPAVDFTFHSLLTSEEIENAKKQDVGDPDDPNAHVAEAEKKNGESKRKKAKSEARAAEEAIKKMSRML
jgi:hypothetical protein